MTAFVIVHVAQRSFYEERLVMIRKNSPDWQAGKLNFPGGHIEKDEFPNVAAARELFEETGLWAKYMPAMGVLYVGEHIIHVFQARGVSGKLEPNKTDEKVELICFSQIGQRDDLVKQNIVIMHGLITNGVSGWTMYQIEHGYELKIPIGSNNEENKTDAR